MERLEELLREHKTQREISKIMGWSSWETTCYINDYLENKLVKKYSSLCYQAHLNGEGIGKVKRQFYDTEPFDEQKLDFFWTKIFKKYIDMKQKGE